MSGKKSSDAGLPIQQLPLEGEWLGPEEDNPHRVRREYLHAEDIEGFDDLVKAFAHVEDVYRTVHINPQEDAIRILPDIYNADGSLNEAVLNERNRRLKERSEWQRIQSEVDDFLWRKGLPLLAFLLIGIAVLTCFI